MQQNSNIENKLRQFDDQQEPDLTHIDEHWQQMQAILQPVSVPGAKGGSTGMIAGGAIVAVILLTTGIFLFQASKQKAAYNYSPAAAKAENNNEKKENNTTTELIKEDTTTEQATATQTKTVDERFNKQPEDDSYTSYIPEAGDSIKVNFAPCDACPDKNADSISNKINKQLLLQNLFSQLSKEEQQFTIDNSRDTLVQGNEGTVLLIPANSFNGKNGVQITVKEFYKHSDMILNQLSTISNKDQLVTGGMMLIKASYNGNEIGINSNNPVRLYMPDTSSDKMSGMQLFNGENENGSINWLPQGQYFAKTKIITEVRVLNIIDQPFKTKQKSKGEVGYFIVNDSIAVDKAKLKEILKEKFGYYKVRLRSNIRNWFHEENGNRMFDNNYSTRIGDSVWMEKEKADKYKLTSTASRQSMVVTGSNAVPVNTELNKNAAVLLSTVQDKYSVKLTNMGWINCDRFYNAPGEKFQYAVNLNDSAKNYYTVLLFDNMNSMMNGFIKDNKVVFPNVPANMPVKIISIGINPDGEPVYAMKQAITGKDELTGLQFETTSAAGLKTALSKIDK